MEKRREPRWNPEPVYVLTKEDIQGIHEDHYERVRRDETALVTMRCPNHKDTKLVRSLKGISVGGVSQRYSCPIKDCDYSVWDC